MSNFAKWTGLSLLAAASFCAGCGMELYCIECDDAGLGPADATPDGCVPGAPERCNGLDDNCDGFVDEGFNFSGDPFNCGGCGVQCETPHALPGCEEGRCVVEQCLPGAADLDGDPENGCEAACHVVTTVTSAYCDGPDCCDGADNDCDGELGEDHDTSADPGNCGGCASACETFPCPHICAAPFAETECRDGACVITGCRDDYYDADGDPLNGCEFHCVATGDESCNGLDDDCDGEVDEDFPNQGLACGCGDLGTLQCVRGSIECVVETPPVEVCDGEDNDCDPSTPDGADDPEVGQPCGAAGPDGCEIGTQVCVGGVVICDESVDPEGQPCGNSVGECSAVWACEAGAFECNVLSAPADEICGDGLDNDCDGDVDGEDDDLGLGGLCDEGTGTGGVGICEFGTRVCDGGEVRCEGFVRPATDEICNGLDDDCNGRVDDGMPLGRTCGPHPFEFGYGGCASGSAADTCWGHLPLRPELCNGFDDDGDGETDEDAPCPEGSECDRTNGMCTIVCRDVDEPLQCPVGMRCVDGRCVGDLCDGVACDECERCDPSTGLCVDRCEGLLCDEGLVCSCGRCWPPTCGVLGCADGQICRDGRCVPDACSAAGCSETQGCADGECFEVCAHEQCVASQICVRGECVEDPCRALSCPAGQCNRETEECSAECVGVHCLPGLACDLSTGRCVDDPCASVHCPEGTFCREGSCYEPPPDLPDGGPDADVGPTPDGGSVNLAVYGAGGGCFCRAAPAPAAGPVSAFVLAVGAGLALVRRRR